MYINKRVQPPYDVSQGRITFQMSGREFGTDCIEIPEDLMEAYADDLVNQAAVAKQCGFDCVYLHMSYRLLLLGRFLSPLTNNRSDRFGGSLENRARFPLMVCDRIKERCGEDFLIEVSISAAEPFAGGWTIDDTIEFARMAQGRIDLFQLRTGDKLAQHPTGFSPETTPNLKTVAAVTKGIRDNGTDIAVVAVGGYHDLDSSEEVIASGQADLIGMARSWIADPDYGVKAYEGRKRDVVPCIRCNKCDERSYGNPWTSVCSVNPTWGLEHKIERMVHPSSRKKKVAVIGGGPAGMEAALVAAGRGHDVTLYESTDALGGLLKTASSVSFKWPVKNFVDYLVSQVARANIKVALNTEAKVEDLVGENYDVGLIAVGSEPIVPAIPGVENKNVVFAVDVYEDAGSLAENIVVVGGGEVGVETGLYLAEKGHAVTLLEMLDTLAPDTTPALHYRDLLMEALEKRDNFRYILNARCTGIAGRGVSYLGKDGVERVVEAGNAVIAVGMKARSDEAMKLLNAADRCFMIGDCDTPGSVQEAMRSAFAIASTV
jgi:NADPH-dependent 2,4-dienoyl-CoA reductase/sulfur reductase-like enzyme